MKINKIMLFLTMTISMIATSASAMSMTYHGFSDGTGYIEMEGEIVVGDVARLKNLLRLHPNAKELYLRSPGGDVDTGQALARLIRSHRLNTNIDNDDDCASACTDVFLGGIERALQNGGDGMRLGYHAAAGEYAGLTDAYIFEWGQFIGTEVALFYIEMIPARVDLIAAVKFLVYISGRDDASIMEWPTIQQLVNYGIVTHTYEPY